ncbi:hypothetical protein CPAR01_00197 [Colletotrichum paranaense]|uniref:Uncharacterized protein n=1 Tax=Colletotrichum paranaense TaxID=1914294 RepID=A0ABQ9T3Q3_9PEZI|nr:uncharacterized protein CPAR01_00197 [Colletotrichum paranaense]KAK1546230.1 hypothetical protein CPAR01_00197 [Colletotrichum paranaense]
MSGFLLPMVVVMFCHIELLPYSASSKLMERPFNWGDRIPGEPMALSTSYATRAVVFATIGIQL